MPADTLQHAPRFPSVGNGGTMPAQPIEVRTRFDGHWTAGFELVGTDLDRTERPYVIRRCSDHTVLPVTFSEDEIRLVAGIGPISAPQRSAVDVGG
jgi:hypothetical protein